MELVSIILNSCITVLALSLFVISLGSYQKHKSQKLLFLSSVFFIFFIKGVIMSLAQFVDELMFLQCSPYLVCFDLLMLVILFTATLKR